MFRSTLHSHWLFRTFSRGVKLMGLTSSVSKQKPTPTLPNSAAANQDTKSTQTQRTADTKATCRPKSHIVFLKTHKTASSSILNILYRYGESRNLTFALPVRKRSQLFYPLFFASHFVEGVASRSLKHFHIMCNHMRFRKSEVSVIRTWSRLCLSATVWSVTAKMIRAKQC